MEVGVFQDKHLAFMDIDAIYFELQRFKNERAWYNLNLPREAVKLLLHAAGKPDWYRLFIPSAEMEFTRFDRVRRWEEIAVALLKKYIDRYYKHQSRNGKQTTWSTTNYGRTTRTSSRNTPAD